MKPGGIIPYQYNKDMKIKKIHDLRERPISLLINRDNNNIASGSVLLDSGMDLAELKLG